MQKSRRKNSRLGLIIIIGTLTILGIILVTAIGGLLFSGQIDFWQFSDQSSLFGNSPLDEIDRTQIDPALALASLGGVPDIDVIAQAVNTARPETALAAILYTPTLTDKETAGELARLANFYQNNPEKATLCLQWAGTVATLSPHLADTARVDLFIQAGEGLLNLEQTAFAELYFDQAFLIASESPHLQAVQRRIFFERLQKNYIILNNRQKARTSLNMSANPPAVGSTATEESVLPPINPIALPADIQESEATRWQYAQELAAIMVERGGSAPLANQQALQQILLTEDAQKLTFFETAFDSAPGISHKIDVIWAKIQWLSIKYRVAKQGYGLSLIPEWEADAEQIRADLTKTYEQLFMLDADLIVALPNATKIDTATLERLRQEVLAGQLGRYPNYPQEQRKKQLLEAVEQFAATRPEYPIITVTTVTEQATANEQIMFTLATNPAREVVEP